MGLIKKNKIHNPQFITDPPPDTLNDSDVGRIWIDPITNAIKTALKDENGSVVLRNLLDSVDLTNIDNAYYKGIEEEFVTIEAQTSGDKHFDNGYDFFSDNVFLQNSTQETDDYFSFYYKEVPETTSDGYVRTISTDAGVKHVRNAVGLDTYTYNNDSYNLVNYSKVVLSKPVKAITDIIFDNKDNLESGFELQDDGKTILIYADPDGYFINKVVKVKYLI